MQAPSETVAPGIALNMLVLSKVGPLHVMLMQLMSASGGH